MKLKVLGSSSPFITEDRNGIGYLITSGENKILLEAGSGISRSLNFDNDLDNLTIIISHLHRDHYAELLPLSYATYIMSKNSLLKNKIKVYIPNDVNSIDKSYVLSLEEDSFFEIIEYSENDILQIGNIKLEFEQSLHSVKTYSIKISEDNKTICYSADTGYANEKLISFANNCDLFICESTFLKNQSKTKDVHLSTLEAASLGKKAKVKLLMLNHFWPLIDKNEYLKEAKEVFNNVITAEENMEFEI